MKKKTNVIHMNKVSEAPNFHFTKYHFQKGFFILKFKYLKTTYTWQTIEILLIAANWAWLLEVPLSLYCLPRSNRIHHNIFMDSWFVPFCPGVVWVKFWANQIQWFLPVGRVPRFSLQLRSFVFLISFPQTGIYNYNLIYQPARTNKILKSNAIWLKKSFQRH